MGEGRHRRRRSDPRQRTGQVRPAPVPWPILSVLCLALAAAAVHATDAASPQEVLRLAYGRAPQQVAGPAEDVDHVTDGFPPAFDVDEKGRVWLLDAARARLAVFGGDGTYEGAYPLRLGKGPRAAPLGLWDLSLAPDGAMALADGSTSSLWLFPAGPRGEPVSLGTIEGVEAVRCVSARRVLVQKRGKVIALGPTGRLERVICAPGIRPWGPWPRLYGLRHGDDDREVEILRCSPSGGSAPFASLASPDSKAFPLVGDLIGAPPRGGVVAVLLVGAPLTDPPDPSDQRLKEDKYALLLDEAGTLRATLTLPHPPPACRVTPRFHRVGADGHLYTARPDSTAYVILRHRLDGPSPGRRPPGATPQRRGALGGEDRYRR